MAIKTFTAGAILTASDTNTFLTNSGLVYITSGNLSGSVTDFVGVFTSTYTNYRILVTNPTLSSFTDLCWQGLVGTTPQTSSNYWVAGTGLDGAGVAYNQNQNVGNPGRTLYSNTNIAGGLVMDMFGPQVPGFTCFTSQATMFQSDNFRSRSGGGAFNQGTQLTGIRFASAGGQTMGGNVIIYGYRMP